MNAKELAEKINGREYGEEITKDEAKAAKKSGLVVIYGASDDLIELCGAIDDEIGAYAGTTLYLHRDGVLQGVDREECRRCHTRGVKLQKKCVKVKCEWDAHDYSWFIVPDCPFEPFDIVEDDDKFCRGVVIDVNDLPVLEED